MFLPAVQQWPLWSLWLPWTPRRSGVKWDQMPNWTTELANTFSSVRPVQFSAHVTMICRKMTHLTPCRPKGYRNYNQGEFLRLTWCDAQLIERLQHSASFPGWPFYLCLRNRVTSTKESLSYAGILRRTSRNPQKDPVQGFCIVVLYCTTEKPTVFRVSHMHA